MPDDGNSAQRLFLGLGIALLVLLLLGLPFGWFGWWNDGTWGDALGMMILMMFLAPVLVVVLIVVFIVALVNKSRQPAPQQPGVPVPAPPPQRAAGWQPVEEPDALAILERRYAAGQLTRSEYFRMRDDLDR